MTESLSAPCYWCRVNVTWKGVPCWPCEQAGITEGSPVMTDRYTVTHSPFGFENDVGSHRLNYAVTDNRPDRVTVYKAIERERVKMTAEEASEYLRRPIKLPPFRHLAYSSCKADAEHMAKAMNLADAALRVERYSDANQLVLGGL